MAVRSQGSCGSLILIMYIVVYLKGCKVCSIHEFTNICVHYVRCNELIQIISVQTVQICNKSASAQAENIQHHVCTCTGVCMYMYTPLTVTS